MRYYKEVLLMLFSCLLFFAGAEAYFRFRTPIPGPKDYLPIASWTSEDYRILHTMDARFHGWRLIPGRQLQHVDRNFQEYNYSIRLGEMNGLGYRLRDDAKVEQCGQTVWHMGDSFAFGFGIDAAETYAGLTDHSPTVCALNLGVPGFTLSQELELFKFHYQRSRVKPKQVTLAVFWGNDVAEQYLLDDQPSQRSYLDHDLPQYDVNSLQTDVRLLHFTRAAKAFELSLLHWSHLYRFLVEKIYLARQKGIAYLEYGLVGNDKYIFPTGYDSVDLHKQSWFAIENFINLAQNFPYNEYPVQFTYLLIPGKEMVLAGKARPTQWSRINAISEVFKARVRSPNLRVVDMFEPFVKEGQFVFFNKDTHINKLGHQLIAQIVSQKLNEQADPAVKIAR